MRPTPSGRLRLAGARARTRGVAPWALLLSLALLPLGGCTDPMPPATPGEAIPRELFIDSYVDLRVEALQRPSGVLTAEESEPVLRRHGVTHQDLRTFIEVHARDMPYMSELWFEIERRIRERIGSSIVTPELAP